MSYTRNTWSNGQVITAAKMNNIEGGIYNNDQKIVELEKKITEFIEASKPVLLWSGSSGDGETIYLTETVENYNYITFVFQNSNGTFYNASFLTALLLRTSSSTFAQQQLGETANTSLYLDSNDRTCLLAWMSSSLKLVEVYGH